MNNIHIVSCPRKGSWQCLYDTLDSISKSNILDFNIHVWAGIEPKDTKPIYNNVNVHINIEYKKEKYKFAGFNNYKRAIKAASQDDISIIIEDDIDVYNDWVDISLQSLNLLDDNALLSMHHFNEDANDFISTEYKVKDISTYKASNNSGLTGAQGYISRGSTWKEIMSLIDYHNDSEIPKIQDVFLLKIWRQNYYILDPCIVKHRTSVKSTWRNSKLDTRHCLF